MLQFIFRSLEGSRSKTLARQPIAHTGVPAGHGSKAAVPGLIGGRPSENPRATQARAHRGGWNAQPVLSLRQLVLIVLLYCRSRTLHDLQEGILPLLDSAWSQPVLERRGPLERGATRFS
jgi:hypothetical protein